MEPRAFFDELRSWHYPATYVFPIGTTLLSSMGGVAVDLSCRVLNRRGQPIPNLHAVGELASVGHINGRAALEG